MTRTILGKLLIVVFCCFHMLSIAVYALSPTPKDPVTAWLRQNVRPDARPYVLFTSQWQRWNLFSPDPLRRVTDYRVETLVDNEWKTYLVLNADSYGWWRRASELKLLRRLEEHDRQEPLRKNYLHYRCSKYGIPAGTSVRLKRRYYVIPRTQEIATRAFWKSFEPKWREVIITTATCPS